MEKHWSLDEVDSLLGKIVIVTGGNSGIGFEASKVLAKKGATLILACRSLERGEMAKAEILKVCDTAKAHVLQLDLADLSSVKKFADEFTEKYDKLDILLNNAGIANYLSYGKTADGIEQHMATNYIGHFVLTALLFETLKNTPKARIVNVASLAHKYAYTDFEDLLYREDLSAAQLYGGSKLGNLLFTYELDRQICKASLDIKVLAAHPGISDTNINVNLDKATLTNIQPFLQTAKQGALPTLRACLDDKAESGMYFGPDGMNEFSGQPVLCQSSDLSYDEVLAKTFFDKTEEFTGVKFDFGKI